MPAKQRAVALMRNTGLFLPLKKIKKVVYHKQILNTQAIHKSKETSKLKTKSISMHHMQHKQTAFVFEILFLHNTCLLFHKVVLQDNDCM